MPTTPGSYTLTATAGGAGYTPDTETITVAGPTSLGTVSITQIGSPNNGVQTFSITVVDTNGDRISGALTVTVSGAGFTTSSVPTANGSGAVNITLPTTAGSYTLTASAQGYESGTAPVQNRWDDTHDADTDTHDTDTDTNNQRCAASSISIRWSSSRTEMEQRIQQLDAALIVQVLDDDGDACCRCENHFQGTHRTGTAFAARERTRRSLSRRMHKAMVARTTRQ